MYETPQSDEKKKLEILPWNFVYAHRFNWISLLKALK